MTKPATQTEAQRPGTEEIESLRVGLCIDRWDPERGGAEKAMAQLAAWLLQKGHRVWAFSRERPERAKDAPGEFVAVRASGLTRARRERNLGNAMLAAARAQACNVIVGVRHMESVDILWPHGGAHAETLRAMDKRAAGRHKAFLQLERTAIQEGGAQRIVCVSELVREEMVEHYPACAERLFVVPNGVDRERYHPSARPNANAELLRLGGWPAGSPVLTFVARNPFLKGLDLVLGALALLQDMSWKLVIAGPREVASIERRVAASFRDPARILVQENVESVTLAAGADLLLLPSRRDPCPLVVLEALAAGTPVLVSDAVGSKDAIRAEAQGAVFATDSSSEELARLIRARLDGLGDRRFTREEISAALFDRGLPDWLGAMEGLLLDFARSKAKLRP